MEDHKGSAFHSPQWISVVSDTYGFTPEAIVIHDDTGNPVAGMAWVDITDLNGTRRISLPFCDFAGPISNNTDYLDSLIATVSDGLNTGSVRSLTVRAFPEELPEGFAEGAKKSVSSWMGIDLSGTEDDIISRITPAARKGTRKARRNGVTFSLASTKDHLRTWFELHLKLRKYRHRLLAQPFEFFERIWDTFIAPGNGYLLLTEMDDQIVGGMFCLQFGDIVYTKFSASDERAHAAKPNNLMYLETLLEAKRRGARLVDMGRNPHSAPGLIYYKESFGAFQKELWSVTKSATTPTGDDDTLGALLKDLTTLFVRDEVPDDATEAAGNLLYRNFA